MYRKPFHANKRGASEARFDPRSKRDIENQMKPRTVLIILLGLIAALVLAEIGARLYSAVLDRSTPTNRFFARQVKGG